MSGPSHVIAIMGPTAVGKSACAEMVAAALGSPIISVDAMQVYRGMDVGTAKTPREERSCPLLMVDVAEVTESYSVRLYQRDARACVEETLDAGRTPVLCGGTGLYLDAVVDEMVFPAGEVGDERRRRYEGLAERNGGQWLHDQLAERDPESARLIHPNNTRRVVRALEMLDEGMSYARHHEGLRQRRPRYDAEVWGLTMSRDALYERIERRVDQMVSDGLEAEVIRLRDRGLTRESTAGQAIGYKEMLSYLDGESSLDQAVEKIKQRTRRYAKRQLSWLRRDGRVRWIDLDQVSLKDAAARIVEANGGPRDAAL